MPAQAAPATANPVFTAPPISDRPWRTREPQPLSADNLRKLFDNEIPLIHVPNFATQAEVDAVVKAYDKVVDKAGMFQVPTEDISYTKSRFIGMPQFQYATRPKADYFADVPGCYALQKQVFDNSFHVVNRMLALVRKNWPGKVEIGDEGPPFGKYYAGIFREVTMGGPVHCGFGPFTAPGYAKLGSIDADVSWNLYLLRPTQGGETTVYNRPWQSKRNVSTPEIFMKPEIYQDAESVTFAPTIGDVIIFNNRNPHGWTPTANPKDGTRRLGTGSFLGRLPNGDIMLYS